MSTVTAPKSDTHIAVNTAVNSVIDPVSNPSQNEPKAASLPPTRLQSSLAAKSKNNDLGPVILPLAALAAPYFTAAEILTPP